MIALLGVQVDMNLIMSHFSVLDWESYICVILHRRMDMDTHHTGLEMIVGLSLKQNISFLYFGSMTPAEWKSNMSHNVSLALPAPSLK